MTSLILLHAFPFDSGMFDNTFNPDLEDTFFAAIDLPGFGSAPLQPDITIDGMADHVAKRLNEPSVIVGVSMGGYVAMAVARRHPHLVKALILADTRAEPDDDATKANRAKAIETVRSQGVAAFVDMQLSKVFGETTRRENTKLVEEIRTMGNRQKADGVIAGIIALRDRPDARPGLQNVKCPVLIVVGEEDVVTPPQMAYAMKGLIPHASLVTIPKAGHLSNCEQPVAFNVAVRTFLSTLT